MEGRQIMPNNKVWLVIEKSMFGESAHFRVEKNADSLDKALDFKMCLEKLNDSKYKSYFLASDIDNVLENVAYHHNKSVENGTYHEKHPEVKRPEIKI